MADVDFFWDPVCPRLWDAIELVARQAGFAELKRSLRERPQLR